MKQDVIDFLGNPPKNESERFNKAVSLYRQSKDHDVTLVRFLNSMGFSKDRLDNVLYELKKLHSVTDLEVANAKPDRKEKREEKKEVTAGEEGIEINEDKDAHTEVQAEDLGTEETEKKLQDHVEANQIEVNDAEEVKAEDTPDNTPEEVAVEGHSKEFIKKLADFDVEAEKYNSIKSFAADVSDVIKQDPKNQKGDTLKAFILEAKKKFAES